MATGRENYEEFYQSQLQGLTVLLDKEREAKIKPSENSVLCPTCGKVMVRRKGKNGYFWSCVAYPECKTTARDNNGKADFTKMVRKPAQTHIVKG